MKFSQFLSKQHPTSQHQWTTFQKGRMKVKACAHCGQMKLPGNTQVICDQGSILTSPIVKAGYQLSCLLADKDFKDSAAINGSQLVA